MKDLNSFKWLKIAIAREIIFTSHCAFYILCSNQAIAQVVPDSTLPINSSIQTTGNTIRIEGGTTTGSNLFHSFSKFSVPTGSTVNFNNSLNIQNIISRVTGRSLSNIDGLIRANGTANLFLLNPNGIIFGRNARLDIGGSFVGTTSSAIGFGERGFFSATNPNTPELLTINPTALLFNQIRAASIENNSVAPSGFNPSSAFIARGLRVPDGKSLLLVGGDIKMDGGVLFAFGGRVELGGLASAGTVGLNEDGNNLSLSFPDNVERSDIFLTNGAGISVTAGDGGSIAFNARNLKMTDRSNVSTGIESGLGSNNSKAGNISVNATVEIHLENESLIANQVRLRANGQGGDINISTGTLKVEGGAQVSTSTRGTGKGGSIRVNAQNVQLVGTSADNRFPSGLNASANSNSTGDAGNLTIATNTLLVRDGARVSTGTFSTGKGGSLNIDAQDIQVIGRSANDVFGSSLNAPAEPNSTGDAGNLTIKTNSLLVGDGAQVSAATAGAGKGGNLTIKTNSLLVEGGAQLGTNTFRAGKGGSLSIDARDIQVIGTSPNNRFASALNASAEINSTGDAGDLTIKTDTLLVRDGAQVSAATFGAGKGGSLIINARDVQVIGISSNNRFPSILAASTQRNSTGDAGDLTIKTDTLLVRNGAQVSAATAGAGKGGSLIINARDVQVIGTSPNNQFRSALGTLTQPNSTGDAGDLTIKTNTLLVRDGAQVSAATLGAGKGGSLSVDAQEVQVIGTSANNQFPSVLNASAPQNSTGDAGDLTIATNTLRVRDGAAVTVQSLGTGTAGIMTLNASSIRLNNSGLLNASTSSAKVNPNKEQATININSEDLIMTRSSNIRTNATGENVIGGNININSDVLAGFENSDITANSSDFRGGNVRINTQGIFGIRFRDIVSPRTSDITATGVSPQYDGTVEVNRPDVDPSAGLIELPVDFVDRSGLMAQGCPANQGNSFIITGRGGLPPLPTDALQSNQTASVNWVRSNPIEKKNISVSKNSHFRRERSRKNHGLEVQPISPPIVEATGWVTNKSGTVELIAFAPTQTHTNTSTNAMSEAPIAAIAACP